MGDIQKWVRKETGYLSGDKAKTADECTAIATGWWIMNGWRGKDRDKDKLAKSCKKYVKEEYKNRRKRDDKHGFVWVLPFIMQIFLSTVISAVIHKLVDWWFSESFEGEYLPLVHDKKYRYNRRHLVYAWADYRIATAPDDKLAKLARNLTPDTLADLERGHGLRDNDVTK
jgi:hypothetical protein